jgi:hypothetical protein
MRRALLGLGALALAGALAASAPAAGGPASGKRLVPDPAGGIYHSAFPDFGDTEDVVSVDRIAAFEALAGKPITWAYTSNNWFKGISFPQAQVDQIHAAGRVPFLRLMPRSGYREFRADRRYTLTRILNGEFDAELTAWGQAAGAQPFPILVEFGTEMNGFWFQWSGKYAGGGRTTGYGDPTFPDGPERFRDAYRHVHDVITAAGADNLTWFWHPGATSFPGKAWNAIANYYPGDAYVDWTGFSFYGAQERGEHLTPFANVADSAYAQLVSVAPTKPVAVLEFSTRQGGRKAGWLRAAIDTIASGRWPQIRALAIWHSKFSGENGPINLRIDSGRAALAAYQASIANPIFVSTPVFAP